MALDNVNVGEPETIFLAASWTKTKRLESTRRRTMT